MYVLLAYGYLGDSFQAWYLNLCIQSSNYVHTIKFTKLINNNQVFILEDSYATTEK